MGQMKSHLKKYNQIIQKLLIWLSTGLLLLCHFLPFIIISGMTGDVWLKDRRFTIYDIILDNKDNNFGRMVFKANFRPIFNYNEINIIGLLIVSLFISFLAAILSFNKTNKTLLMFAISTALIPAIEIYRFYKLSPLEDRNSGMNIFSRYSRLYIDLDIGFFTLVISITFLLLSVGLDESLINNHSSIIPTIISLALFFTLYHLYYESKIINDPYYSISRDYVNFLMLLLVLSIIYIFINVLLSIYEVYESRKQS